MQCKEYSDANSELFKKEYDEALHENTCEIEFCDLISVSLRNGKQKAPASVGAFCAVDLRPRGILRERLLSEKRCLPLSNPISGRRML